LAAGLSFTIDGNGRFLMTQGMVAQFPFAGVSGDQFIHVSDLLAEESGAVFAALLADTQTCLETGLTRRMVMRDLEGRMLQVGLTRLPGLAAGRLLCSLDEHDVNLPESVRSHRLAAAGELPSRTEAFRHAVNLASDGAAIDDGFKLMLVGLNRPGNLEGPVANSIWAQVTERAGMRLQAVVSGRGLVARYADDTFVVIGANRTDGPLLPDMAAGAITSSFDHSFEIEGMEFYVSVTLGMAEIGPGPADIGHCFRCAELALDEARRSGVPVIEISPEMISEVRSKLQFERDLREAFEYDGFELELQPKKDMVSGAFVGFEALIRWRHPERGLIAPEDFIPAAEESGLIVPITDWVLHEVCRLLNAERTAGRRPLPISINVPPSQLMRRELKDFMKIINAYDVPPALVEFELTESMSSSEISRGISVMSSLRAAGVKISVEDFGTGYSSLSRLVRLPVSVLKIDRSFVEGLPTDAAACEVVTAITRAAHALDLTVVAEGVETETQAEFLAQHGVEIAQGFLFCRPLPPDQAFRLAERGGG
jgi:EAL domain-containing protein (putative c-di-GMP-specific phosphodiesterase class I)/GGDEF domain-containing protein